MRKIKKKLAFQGQKIAALFFKIKVFDNLRWKKFTFQNKHLVEYQKLYQSPALLIAKLQSEGLTIPPTGADKVIFENNYYRFKAYFIPHFDMAQGKFYANTSFGDIYSLYVCDQQIRDFVFSLISKLEIRARAVLDNIVTKKTNDPFWHLNPTYFKKYEEIQQILNKSGTRFRTGKQEFAIHYRSKYFTKKSFEYKFIPPFWIISEIFTLEHLVTFAKNINTNHDLFKISGDNELNVCSKYFGFDGYEAWVTNLQCLLELRNICAHHSRLWNKNLRSPSGISKKITIKEPNSSKSFHRLYSHLIMIRIMCKSLDIDDGIKPFFDTLINSNATLQRDHKSMGFPSLWETDPIWA